MDYRERNNLLMKLRDVIKANEKKIYEALKKDLGKAKFEAYETEIGPILMELNYTMKYLTSWMQFKTVPTPFFHMPATSTVYRQPHGRVLILAPWNEPFVLSLIPLIHAWAAGNEVTLYPSGFAKESQKLLYEMLMNQFPISRIRVVTGGECEKEKLLEKEFDFMFCIGSRKEGQMVLEAAAKQMIPTAIQIYGKNPCIIDRECHLKYAARQIVWGKFLNCGQNVMAPDFVLIEESQKQEFLSYVERYIKKFYGEEPLKSVDYGKLVSQEHMYHLLDLMEHQEILLGGEVDISNNKISPTVVLETSLCSEMMKESILGPILPIMTYDGWEDGVEKLSRFPDTSAVYAFTKNKKHEEWLKEQCITGSLCINDVLVQGSSPYLPIGGVGAAGMGRFHGKAGFDTFSIIKSVMKRNPQGDSRIKHPPFAGKLKMLKRILK